MAARRNYRPAPARLGGMRSFQPGARGWHGHVTGHPANGHTSGGDDGTAIRTALASLGVNPGGNPTPAQQAIDNLRGLAAGTTPGPVPRRTQPYRPTGPHGEPPLQNYGWDDGQAPFNANLPLAMTNPGDPAHPMPHMAESDARKQALERMLGNSAGFGAQVGANNSTGPVSPGAATPGDIRATLAQVAARLKKRGIKGDITVGKSEAGEPFVQGPRGRKYPVFAAIGA